MNRTEPGALQVRCRAVIFDLDGTLLDTLADLANAMNAVLGRNGFPPHGLEAYKRMVGDGVRMLVHRALPEAHRNDATLEALVSQMRAEYRLRQREHTRPYPGVHDLLSALRAHHIPMAILTNKPHEATVALVGTLLAPWHFDIVQGECPEIPRKPDPAGALRIASMLGIPTREILYLGDTDTDMITATAAGMVAVGVLWGFRSAEELLAHGARILLDEPLELLKWMA